MKPVRSWRRALALGVGTAFGATFIAFLIAALISDEEPNWLRGVVVAVVGSIVYTLIERYRTPRPRKRTRPSRGL